MKTWKKGLTAAAVVISTAAVIYMYAGLKNNKGEDVRVVPVSRGSITSYLSSGGTVQSMDRREHFVYSPAKVEKVYVSIGDEVKPNELLVKLEAADFSPQLKQAYIQIDIAETSLNSLKKQKKEYEKLKELEVTQMETGAPDNKINMPSLDDIEDRVKLQEKQVELAKVNLNSIKDKITNTQSQIKSDISGIVTGINTVEGGMANAAIPAVTVENTSNIKAVLNVSQYDVLKVKEGQEALIKVGGGSKKYMGIVERINPTAKKSAVGLTAEAGIPVDIRIINPDSDIKIGFEVDVDINTGARDNTLYIPYEAVITDKEGSDRVFTVVDDRAVLKDITIGIESDLYVEVLSGLLKEDKVILNPSPELKNGMIVNIRE